MKKTLLFAFILVASGYRESDPVVPVAQLDVTISGIAQAFDTITVGGEGMGSGCLLLLTATAVGGQPGEYALWRPSSVEHRSLDGTSSHTVSYSWVPDRIGTGEVQQRNLIRFQQQLISLFTSRCGMGI
jgi:hypothetical protein